MKKDEFIERYGEEAYQKCLECSKRWREKNRKKHLEAVRNWQKNHKEEYRETNHKSVKNWIQNHPERYKEQKRNWFRQNKNMFAYVLPEEKCLIENYDKALADNFEGWDIHHRLETHTSDSELRPVAITRDELIALDMYYARPASELIFLTRSEHTKLHRSLKNQ